ncbi:MAG: hypothetical protein OSA98_03670 [Rubripirellula sp.]|nr:hypothetical protein [Rubripirellula sp.]
MIRKIVARHDGRLENNGWLVTGDSKVYSSVPDHYHSGLGELILVELEMSAQT